MPRPPIPQKVYRDDKEIDHPGPKLTPEEFHKAVHKEYHDRVKQMTVGQMMVQVFKEAFIQEEPSVRIQGAPLELLGSPPLPQTLDYDRYVEDYEKKLKRYMDKQSQEGETLMLERMK